MTSEELSYLAGFFDGEGCISIDDRKPAPRNPHGQLTLSIQVTQKNKMPLLLFEKSEFGIIHQRKDGEYSWRVYGRGALGFLLSIYPYLSLKKKEAERAILFQELKGRGGRGRGRCLSQEEKEKQREAYVGFRQAFNERGLT